MLAYEAMQVSKSCTGRFIEKPNYHAERASATAAVQSMLLSALPVL